MDSRQFRSRGTSYSRCESTREGKRSARVEEYLPLAYHSTSETPETVFEKARALLLDFLGSKQLVVGNEYEKELDDNDKDQFSNARRYTNVSWHHRLFIMLEDPGSSAMGKLWSTLVALVTVVSVLLYIIDSVPELSSKQTTCNFPVCVNDAVLCPGTQLCEPDSSQLVKSIEEVCIFVFIIDYFSRILLCGTVPSHLAGCVDSELLELEPLDLDDEGGDNSTNLIPPPKSSEMDDSCHSRNSSLGNSASGKHLKELQKSRTLLRDEQLHLQEEAARRERIKRLTEEHHKKERYWIQMRKEAKDEDAPWYKRLYVALFHPVTELTYDPEEDPVHSWARQQYLYTFKIMNMVDFVAILPYWLSFMQTKGTSFSVVRVLRLARVLRILKLGKGSEGIPILYNTVKESLPALLILGFFSLIGVVLMGSIIYFFEQGTFAYKDAAEGPQYYRLDVAGLGQEISPFNSIPMSMYYIVITSTTVGFGDLSPRSYAGRLMAIVAAYLGMFVLALPISVIGNNFMRFNDQKLGNQSHAVNFALFELVGDSPELTMVQRGCHDDAHKTALSAHERRRLVVKVASKRLASVFNLAKALLVHARTQDLLCQMREMHVHLYVNAMVYLEEERLSEKLLHGCTNLEKEWVTNNFRSCSIEEARKLEMPLLPPSEHLIKFIRFEAERTYCHLELETYGGKNPHILQRLVSSARTQHDPTSRYHVFFNDPEALRANAEYSELVEFVATLLGETDEEEQEEDEIQTQTARHSRLTDQLDEVKEALHALTLSLENFHPSKAAIKRERDADEKLEKLIHAQHVRRKNHGKEIFASLLKQADEDDLEISNLSHSGDSESRRHSFLSRGKYRPSLSAPQLGGDPAGLHDHIPSEAVASGHPHIPDNNDSNSNSINKSKPSERSDSEVTRVESRMPSSP